MDGGTPWSRALIRRLSQLWEAGDACRIIHAKINREFGTAFSKSAIIGKIHRLKLTGRSNPVVRRPLTDTERQIRAKQLSLRPRGPRLVRVKLPPPSSPEAERMTYYASLGLSQKGCAYPIGDPKHADFHFCGERAVNGKPYCPIHSATCFIIVKPGAKPQSAAANTAP